MNDIISNIPVASVWFQVGCGPLWHVYKPERRQILYTNVTNVKYIITQISF